MATKLYDPTVKALVETAPESWPAFLGRPTGPTEVIDSDIATVSGAADKVLRVSADPTYLIHLEFVSGHDVVALPRKMNVRSGLLEDRHELLVRSVVVLLRPESDSPQLTGKYTRGFEGEKAYLTFRYEVVRVWKLPPQTVLNSGLGILALAPISDVTKDELPGIIKQIEQRLSKPRARSKAKDVWAAAYLLAGLRYSVDFTAQLFRGVISMKESSTYQAILEEGRTEGLDLGRIEGLDLGRTEGLDLGRTEGALNEARKLLRKVGNQRLGQPDAPSTTAIDQIDDLTRLEELFERLSSVDSWQELLGQLATARREGKRRRTP